MSRHNPHVGSSFDDFLAENGIEEEVAKEAIKQVLAWMESNGARPAPASSQPSRSISPPEPEEVLVGTPGGLDSTSPGRVAKKPRRNER